MDLIENANRYMDNVNIDGMWCSKDGTVEADVIGRIGEKLDIYDFLSKNSGKGNAKRALIELKNKYNHIHVHGIGCSSNDSSWKFWVHMKNSGFVDYLYDDYDKKIN